MNGLKSQVELSSEDKKIVEELKKTMKSKPIKVLKKGESRDFKKIDKRIK